MVQEEMRLKLMRSVNPVRSAHIAATDRECYNCEKVGHVSYNCPTPRSSGARGSMRGGYGGFDGNCGGFGENHGGRGGDRGGRRGRGRRRGAPQANVGTEDGRAITLTGEHVTQWE
uniref:CCHC-type domain-containing protein n=1 Tax=Oryza brachyantha TaxID=4533 RepID=J3N1C8_ORYBR